MATINAKAPKRCKIYQKNLERCNNLQVRWTEAYEIRQIKSIIPRNFRQEGNVCEISSIYSCSQSQKSSLTLTSKQVLPSNPKWSFLTSNHQESYHTRGCPRKAKTSFPNVMHLQIIKKSLEYNLHRIQEIVVLTKNFEKKNIYI